MPAATKTITVQPKDVFTQSITTACDLHIVLKESARCELAIKTNQPISVVIDHEGAHTTSTIVVASALGNEEKSTITLTTNHLNNQQTSAMWVRSTANDTAFVDIKGTIHIKKEVKGIKAQYQNKNLQLSAKAKIFTQPILTIDSQDVQCSHGATVGQLDEAQLFYLRSRGFSELAAQELLQTTFFEEIFNQIENASLAATIRQS